METNLCKVCGIEKPTTAFRLTRWDSYETVCRECYAAKHRKTYAAKRPKIGGGNVSDPDFDGKQIVEVMQIMSRAKKWLESRGCKIQLSGEITKIHKLKF